MLEFAKKLSRRAGRLALGYYKRGVVHTQKSSPADLVTEADIAVNDFIIKEIKKKFPNHGIISEESDEDYNSDAEYVWVIDPIDGTRNFANHIAIWCTMIGLVKNGEPFIGVVYDPINDELFYAKKGNGAYLNGEKIKVNSRDDVQYAFLSYSGGVVDKNSPYSPGKFQEFRKFYNNLMGDRGHWIRNLCTMLELCHLAAGRIDAVIKNSGMFHDYLAPCVIATEAGAKFTDYEGENWKKGRKDIVVANPKLHKKLLKLFYDKKI